MSWWDKMFGGGKPQQPAPTPTPTPAPAATPPAGPRTFALRQTVLYQADEVIQERLANPATLTPYVNSVIEAANQFWGQFEVGQPRAVTLIVAFKPGAQTRYWLESEPAGLDEEQTRALCERLEKLPPPLVTTGPVALALQCSLWGMDGSEDEWPSIPTEWAAASRHRSLEVPDEVLQIVWPD